MSTYLTRAEWAVDYVKNTARIKTGNRFEAINREQVEKTQTNQTVAAVREFSKKTFPTINPKGPLTEVFLRAQVAKFRLCGNCTEQSAIAFDYLYHQRNERGMAWVSFPNHDHMFTVLGLQVQPPKQEVFRIGFGPPASWSATAVVCDPWYQEWFAVATDWDRKIRHILRETSGGPVAHGTQCIVECRAYA
jgi:hypothetical protein